MRAEGDRGQGRMFDPQSKAKVLELLQNKTSGVIGNNIFGKAEILKDVSLKHFDSTSRSCFTCQAKPGEFGENIYDNQNETISILSARKFAHVVVKSLVGTSGHRRS